MVNMYLLLFHYLMETFFLILLTGIGIIQSFKIVLKRSDLSLTLAVLFLIGKYNVDLSFDSTNRFLISSTCSYKVHQNNGRAFPQTYTDVALFDP